MKIFSRLYDLCLRWARHRHAPYYLGTMSFAESVIFPIPVDVMLAPMALARPENWVRYALIASIASVLGGILGYLLGYFAFETLVQPWLVELGYQATYERTLDWFDRYGIWVVFIAGFTPIPYKVFTITAGALQMAFLPFVVASAIGRSARFFLVAGLVSWGGSAMEQKLRHYVDWIGWSVIGLAIIAFILYK